MRREVPRRGKESLRRGAPHVIVFVIQCGNSRRKSRGEEPGRERVSRRENVSQREKRRVPHFPLAPPQQHQHRAHHSLHRRRGQRKEPRAQRLRASLPHGGYNPVADVVSEPIEGEQAQQTHSHVLEPRSVGFGGEGGGGRRE